MVPGRHIRLYGVVRGPEEAVHRASRVRQQRGVVNERMTRSRCQLNVKVGGCGDGGYDKLYWWFLYIIINLHLYIYIYH